MAAKRVVNTTVGHDELAGSLLGHLRGGDVMAWADVQLGPSGSPRPDVYTIRKSFVSPRPMAYECKVSRSDFLADVTTGKWQTYLRYASGVVFACEGNLLSPSDVPTHCGLIVLKTAWRLVKRPILSPVTIPEEALLKLLIDGVEREGSRYRIKAWKESMYWDELKRKFGEATARTVADRLGVEREIESAKRTAQRIVEDAQFRADRIKTEAADLIAPLRAELCDVLGLPADTYHGRIKQEVCRLRQEMSEHPAHAALRSITNNLRRTLDQHGYREPVADEHEAAR